jgi:DNA-binding response OmpR family regulator
MDVEMPEMDGFEATALIRKQEANRKQEAIREPGQSAAKCIPIVAMTAHAMVGDRERCLAAGMDDYVSKPINANDLYAAIERAMVADSHTPSRRHSHRNSRRHSQATGERQGQSSLVQLGRRRQFHGLFQLSASGVDIPPSRTAHKHRHPRGH